MRYEGLRPAVGKQVPTVSQAVCGSLREDRGGREEGERRERRKRETRESKFHERILHIT